MRGYYPESKECSAVSYITGRGTLINGNAIIRNSRIGTQNSIFVSHFLSIGTIGRLGLIDISDGTTAGSFTVNSSSALDQSTFNWVVLPFRQSEGYYQNNFGQNGRGFNTWGDSFLTAGSVTINLAEIRASTIIILAYKSISGTSGVLSISSQNLGTVTIISSAGALDNSQISFGLFQ